MNTNIYKIEQEYLSIVNELEDSEGELTPELEELISINAENRDNKFKAYSYVIRQKEADINLAKDEISRFKNLILSNTKVISRLKSTIVKALDIFDLRNKAGNLYYKLDETTFTTRKTETVIPKIEDLDVLDEITYSEYIDFIIKTKLTKPQLDRIALILKEDNITEVSYSSDISNSKVKDAYESLFLIEDESEREIKEEFLSHLAIIEKGISLTIK